MSEAAAPAIEFKNVSKKFGSFFANQDFSFAVQAGSIHGLIGENGAGKSTAMKTLFGIHPADQGEIFIHGKLSSIQNPVQAMRLGIGMVHQHFMLAGPESVLDNIILGHEPGRSGFGRGLIDRKKALHQLEEISKNYGLPFDRWKEPVDQLSVGEQQRVEIIKLLYQKSSVFILDEPTAVLTPQEVKELFINLRRLKNEGKTIILISHKLKEVLEYTDAITVMRRGKGIGTKRTKETNEDELAEMMVGRKVSFTYQGERKITFHSSHSSMVKPVLKVHQLSVLETHEPLKNVSFELKPGEVLGVAGVQGNGQSQLLRYLSNPRAFRSTAEGTYQVHSEDVSHHRPLELRKSGVGLVPEDRLAEGLFLRQDMNENFLLGQHEDARYSRFGFLKRKIVRKVVESKIKEFDIRPPYSSVWAGRMSGGNQQKLVIARALDPGPSILMVAHPTRGVDVGAIEKIHEEIMRERNRGKAILLFSSELDELIDLSDRMIVFFAGEVRAEFARQDFDSWAIGKVMGGAESCKQE